MKTLLFSFLLISAFGYSQNKIRTINLSDSGNSLNIDYLKQLDSIFEKSRIIGLGESTHGTSEFTTIRAQIFKYLVKNHNYSIFFLEADYNACSRVNRYIHGNEDIAKEALLEVRLWPWLTQELLDFIEWMRIYNLQNNNILEFVGCDMQLIVDDKKEFKRYLSMDSKFHEYEQKFPSLDFDRQDSSTVVSKQKEWLKFSDAFFKSFPDEEPLLVKSINQWFEDATHTGYKKNFRDSCMGHNIADYIEQRPTKKGIYFAHNAHVGKISSQFTRDTPLFRRAGSFLSERLQNEYYSIALDFNTGSFNAMNYINSQYVMEFFTIKKSKKKSLARYALNQNDNIKFVPVNSISGIKKLKINSIGAIYGKSKSGYNVYRYRKFEKKNYDAYIIINKGTPTGLLTMTSKKNKG